MAQTDRYSVVSFALLAVTASRGAVAEDDFFEKRIRPVLAQHCFDCHGADAQESGLRVDSRSALLRGGERGPVVVPGKPDESLLIQAVRHGEALKMPPKRKLATRELADLEQWVAAGATWPGTIPESLVAGVPPPDTPAFSPDPLRHWAFRMPTQVTVPSTRSVWGASALDAFILAELERRQLSPAPEADRRTLIRRATLDLLGLPPTVEEIDWFLADDGPDAWPRLVDRLLSSPRYGERWGRHWLDVARYADSNGLDENLAYANAFRYRDYVIRSWNADLPFDQFIREQLAGDLLAPSGCVPVDLDRITATGFLILGAKMLAEDDPVKMQMDIVDEQVDTIGRVFLGMTLGCARCHDHKFDPISVRDYYGLAGILASTKTMETHTVVARWMERTLAAPDQIADRDQRLATIAALDKDLSERITGESRKLLQSARRHAGDYLLAAQHQEAAEARLASLVPFGNDAQIASRPGAMLIEAEQYRRGNVRQDTDTSYGIGIGVLVNRGETPNFAEYELEIAEASAVQFEVRYAAASSRPTKLFINGRLMKADIAGGGTGGWLPENQVWKVEGRYLLQAGLNVLRLEQPQFFPHIDKLLLVPVSETEHGPRLVPLDPDYQLLAELVGQWRAFLKHPPADPSSPLTAWHAAGTDVTWDQRRVLAENIQEATTRFLDDWEHTAQHDPGSKPPGDAAGQTLRDLLFAATGPFRESPQLEVHFPDAAVAEIKRLRGEKTARESDLPQYPAAMAAIDDQPRDLRVHIRGSHLTLGALAPRALPAMLCRDEEGIDAAHSGRMELANWIADPDNPLTARVLANRIWQWHFGAGIVRTPDNFGRLGERPTHPELLDWLARALISRGWSVKSLHRQILLSATYRMGNRWNEQAAEVDPHSVWHWRFNRRRLEAESVRDSLLSVSGQLDLRMEGSLLPTENRKYVTSTASVDPVIYDAPRRSVYLPVVRSALFDVFQAFDFADPSVSQGKRETTTVAPQALFLMNSRLVSELAGKLAVDLLTQPTRTDADRVHELFQRALGRPPDPLEQDRAIQFIANFGSHYATLQPDAKDGPERAWQSLCRSILSINEFVYVE